MKEKEKKCKRGSLLPNWLQLGGYQNQRQLISRWENREKDWGRVRTWNWRWYRPAWHCINANCSDGSITKTIMLWTKAALPIALTVTAFYHWTLMYELPKPLRDVEPVSSRAFSETPHKDPSVMPAYGGKGNKVIIQTEWPSKEVTNRRQSRRRSTR